MNFQDLMASSRLIVLVAPSDEEAQDFLLRELSAPNYEHLPIFGWHAQEGIRQLRERGPDLGIRPGDFAGDAEAAVARFQSLSHECVLVVFHFDRHRPTTGLLPLLVKQKTHRGIPARLVLVARDRVGVRRLSEELDWIWLYRLAFDVKKRQALDRGERYYLDAGMPQVPSASELATLLRHFLSHIEDEARAAGRGDDPEVRAGLQQATIRLDVLDLSAPEVERQLTEFYRRVLMPLQALVHRRAAKELGAPSITREKAVPSAEILEAPHPDLVLLGQAMESFQGDRYEEAISRASRVPSSSNHHAQAVGVMAACHLRLGVGAASRGELDSAIDHLTQAASLAPENARVREQLSVARQLKADEANRKPLDLAGELYKQGRYEDALEQVSKVPESSAHRKNAASVAAACHNALGVAAAERRDFRGARVHLERAVALEPDDITLRRNLRVVEEVCDRLARAAPRPPYPPSWLSRLLSRLRRPGDPRQGAKDKPYGPVSDQAGEEVPPVLPSAPPGASPEVPGGSLDRLHFAVTSPPVMKPGASYMLDLWAHLEQQRQEVLERARQETVGGKVHIQSRGPFPVSRGAVLTVGMWIRDLTVEPVEDTIWWQGEVGNARFFVGVPRDASQCERQGVAKIYVAGQRIATLAFVVQIGKDAAPTQELPLREKRHRTAFASYASDDRDAVLARLQGMEKARPEMQVSLDKKDLHSGDNWQERLRQEIVTRDVFYLFWSRAASRSDWVEWEWKCALRERGFDFIDPVPLVSPEEVPPPRELAGRLHFDDWHLAYMRGRAQAQS